MNRIEAILLSLLSGFFILIILACQSKTVTGTLGGSSSPQLISGSIELLAGHVGSTGNFDGIGSNSGFNNPTFLTTDSQGNAYVLDAVALRKITPQGVVTTIDNLMSNGGVAVNNGYIYVVINKTIQKYSADGSASTLVAGSAGNSGSADGNGSAATFSSPAGMAFDSAGNLYVVDSGNSTIRKITPNGDVTTLAGSPGVTGSADGLGSNARFLQPWAICVDHNNGNIYVTDVPNNNVRMITPAGNVTTIAGATGVQGTADGIGTNAQFNNPYGIAIDSAGNLYVADKSNNTIRAITPGGSVSTLAGVGTTFGYADGTGGTARLSSPMGIAMDANGDILVADNQNSVIRKVTSAGVVTTLAGAYPVSGASDGLGAAATFTSPWAIVVDSNGNVYVADTQNHAIRKITPDGVVTTVSSAFTSVTALAIDSSDVLYVANGRAVEKVTTSGVITLLAGSIGNIGHANGIGAAATFNYIGGLTVDTQGNVYVSDTYNSMVRKIAPDGTVTTIAGSWGNTDLVDGVGTAAAFYDLEGITVAPDGTLFVADLGNCKIRKIAPDTTVTTLAGDYWGGCGDQDGAGTNALFNVPWDIKYIDGSLYVSDLFNNKVKNIKLDGTVTTFLGSSTYFGTQLGSLTSALSYPRGIAAGPSNSLFISESNVIVKVNRSHY